MRGVLGEALEPRRGVDGVADHRVFHSFRGANVARHDDAAVEANPHAESVLIALFVQPVVEAGEPRTKHLAGCN